MAVGSTEIVTGFDTINETPYGPKIVTAGVCGKCGAMVAPGFESTHATWHGTAGWVQTAGMTNRPGRTAWESNAP
jgi:hypothetical protein